MEFFLWRVELKDKRQTTFFFTHPSSTKSRRRNGADVRVLEFQFWGSVLSFCSALGWDTWLWVLNSSVSYFPLFWLVLVITLAAKTCEIHLRNRKDEFLRRYWGWRYKHCRNHDSKYVFGMKPTLKEHLPFVFFLHRLYGWKEHLLGPWKTNKNSWSNFNKNKKKIDMNK